MKQKIVCREGRCREVETVHAAGRDDIVGLIGKDLLENELRGLYDE